MSILQDIISNKKLEVLKEKNGTPLEILKERAQDEAPSSRFARALKGNGISVIAEIKKASPSRGILNNSFDHRLIAQEFEAGGAKALSVVTDEKFFQGRPEFVHDVRKVSSLPVLRKDFIIDEYQIYQSKVLGAEAILLIVKILEGKELERFSFCAETLGMDVLVEVHTEAEIEAANTIGARLIGINNRDLDTFEVSIDRSLGLRDKISPRAISVSESGISSSRDIERLRSAGFDAVLIGEWIAAKEDRVSTLKAMMQI